ncbi:MAG: SCO6880 family protein [Acidimicrobiales bacterium]
MTVPIRPLGTTVAEREVGQRVRYRFSPLERRGVIAGWRGGQIGVVAGGLVLAVAALRSRPSIGGAALAMVAVTAGVAGAFWPIRGRTGEEWLPLVTRWTWSGAIRSRRQLAAAPGWGHRVTVERTEAGAVVRVRPPAGRSRGSHSVFSGIALERVPIGRTDPPMLAGVLIDGPARCATAVLAVRGHNFALLGPGDQDSRVAGWARVLATMAREGSEVHRMQWIESSLPDDGNGVRNHLDRYAAAESSSPAVRSYGALIDEAAPVTRRHRVLMAVTVHTARSSRAIRASGGGLTGIGALLTREIDSLRRALEAADVTVDGVLGAGALAGVISEATSPVCGIGAHSRFDGCAGGRHSGGYGVEGAEAGSPWPWPMALEPRWETVRTDGTWHVTYWIAEWPRVDVTPDFLGPLLFAPLRRSMSLIMEPVSPIKAARQVAQARTADLADRELRNRGGFLTTARQRRERESVEDRDVELADGHAQYRFTGYVTVTAESEPDLSSACTAIEQAAGQARIELRRLYGEQDVAFVCSLPLGRGLA